MKTILFLISTLLSYSNPEVPTLTVEITNMKEAIGDMIISVYSPENEFLGEETYKTYTVKVESPITKASINLPAGNYGIFVGHDKNRDGEINTNFIGLPTEAVGVSQNKFGGFSKPDFEECEVKLNSNQTIKIELVHY